MAWEDLEEGILEAFAGVQMSATEQLDKSSQFNEFGITFRGFDKATEWQAIKDDPFRHRAWKEQNLQAAHRYRARNLTERNRYARERWRRLNSIGGITRCRLQVLGDAFRGTRVPKSNLAAAASWWRAVKWLQSEGFVTVSNGRATATAKGRERYMRAIEDVG